MLGPEQVAQLARQGLRLSLLVAPIELIDLACEATREAVDPLRVLFEQREVDAGRKW